MFELEYLKYTEIISGKTSDVNLLISSPSLYENLKKEAFLIYDKIPNKETWIKAEIISLIDKNIVIPLNFNKDFKKYYLESLLRFDLIDEYLKNKNLIFDVTVDLNKIFDKFLCEKKVSKVLHVLFIMITNSIANESTFHFVEKLLDFYTSNKDYEDKTLIYEIETFLEENYSEMKVNYIREKYPLIF